MNRRYQGTSREDGHLVAIKVLSDTELKPVCMELLLQKAVSHAHVVDVERTFLWSHQLYVAARGGVKGRS